MVGLLRCNFRYYIRSNFKRRASYLFGRVTNFSCIIAGLQRIMIHFLTHITIIVKMVESFVKGWMEYGRKHKK